MIAKVHSACLYGIDARPIQIELECRPGLPYMVIVGLADRAILEARERIQSAIRSTPLLSSHPQRITVNLAPAQLPKSGTSFDVGIIAAYYLSSHPTSVDLARTAFLGEVALDGKVRAVTGAGVLCEGLKQAGFRTVVLPRNNYIEASSLSGIKLVAIASVTELINYLATNRHPTVPPVPPIPAAPLSNIPLWNNAQGQLHAKAALTIAAAGGHNLMLVGVPGVGKTMLAKSLPALLPGLTAEESWQLTKIYSVAGQTVPVGRPLRSPHHSTPATALLGGGRPPRPGEVTLAHKGVLLLDEVAEFPRATLEALRQVLDSKSVTVARLAHSCTFPADFQLVATGNPCPCGYFGDPHITCSCSNSARQAYSAKLSGPFRDRLDILVSLHREEGMRVTVQDGDPRAQVEAAQQRQVQRYQSNFTNATAPLPEYYKAFRLRRGGEKLLEAIIRKHHYSTRVAVRLMRVARTVADLNAQDGIGVDEIAEAASFRLPYSSISG